MTITSELIGKLGGSDVSQIPLEVTASGSSGSVEVFHTVEVPEGETWLVVLHGNLQSYREGSSGAHLYIENAVLDGRPNNGITGLAYAGTGTIEVGLRRKYGSESDTFTGTVYTVKL